MRAVLAGDGESFSRGYSTVFNDKVSKLKGYRVRLHIDESVWSRQQPCRRLPFHLVAAAVREIDRMLAGDIWERVDKPPWWVSPRVIAPKPKKPGARCESPSTVVRPTKQLREYAIRCRRLRS